MIQRRTHRHSGPVRSRPVNSLGLAALFMSVSACASTPASNPDAAAPAAPAAASAAPAAAPAPAASPTPVSTEAVASPALPLPSGSQRYRFRWDGQLDGTATRSLSCQQNNCTLRTEASVPGVATLSEVSRFQWQQDHVHFEDYQRTLQLLFFPQSVHISRHDGQINTERKGKLFSYPDQPDLIDTLSLEAQLRADLVRGGKLKSRYNLAELKGPAEVTLTELPHETLTLEGKKIATRVFQRRNTDGSRETTFWLDPAQTFLPVQVIHKEGSETYRLIWLGSGS